MKSGINPFDSQEAKPYKNDPEILAMTNLVSSYQNNDINEFETILKQNRRNIMDDPFIREHIEGGYVHADVDNINSLLTDIVSLSKWLYRMSKVFWSSCFDCAGIINRWQSCALLWSFLDQRMLAFYFLTHTKEDRTIWRHCNSMASLPFKCSCKGRQGAKGKMDTVAYFVEPLVSNGVGILWTPFYSLWPLAYMFSSFLSISFPVSMFCICCSQIIISLWSLVPCFDCCSTYLFIFRTAMWVIVQCCQ